jgi:endonuclease/exonuclease/phosphatase family metal-dependent hydrolase
MKHLITTISLIAFLTIGQLTHAQTFRVGSYNIKFDDTRDPINNWAKRKDNVIGLLKYHEVDLFGTQEGLYQQLEDIKNGLGNFAYVGVGRDDGKQKGEYSAFFYNTDKFEVITSGTFWLSETPQTPSMGWDADYPRVCSWAEMIEKSSGKKFYMFNTHFDHVGVKARENSAKLILDRIEQIAQNNTVILTGDFNVEPDKAPYKALSAIMKDSKLISETTAYGPDATFNGFHFEELPTRRIDYIFVKGNVKVLTYAALSDSKNMLYPSDHFPVVADLSIDGVVK